MKKTKIQIVNLMKSLKDCDMNLDSICIDNEIYIVNTNILNKLLEHEEYPIEKHKAIKRILDFLSNYDRNKEPFTLHSLIMKDIFTSKSGVYKDYLNILNNLEILKRQNTDRGWYVPKEQSSTYKFYTNYFNVEDVSLYIIEGKDKMEYSIDERLDLDKRFIDTIFNLDIPLDRVIEAEIEHYHNTDATLEILKKRINNILQLKKKRYINKGNKVERVYHSISNLSKVARKYLNYKGEQVRFHNIDIRNCQPLLLASVLKGAEYNVDNNYIESVESGNFYENFFDITNDRETIKIELYKSVFFYWNEKNDFNKLFCEKFPITAQSIKQMNIESMAQTLQNEEANLFNNLIPKKSKLFFTLFDSIYFDNYEDMFDLTLEIETYFLNKGLRVKLNIE